MAPPSLPPLLPTTSALDDFVHDWLSTTTFDTERIMIVQDSHRTIAPANGDSPISPSHKSLKKQSRWSSSDLHNEGPQKLTTQYGLLQTIRSSNSTGCIPFQQHRRNHHSSSLQSASSLAHTSLSSPPKQPRRSITPESCCLPELLKPKKIQKYMPLPSSMRNDEPPPLSSSSSSSSSQKKKRTAQQVTSESLRIALGLLAP